MKKLGYFLLVAFLAVWAGAADKRYSFNVQHALTNALDNERAAAVRYDACAAKADEEGYPGAAALFHALAKAERVHARRFVAALQRGGTTPGEDTREAPSVGSTSDNLRASAGAEQKERDGTYKDAIEAAKASRDVDITKLFDQTRDAETEHGNLCAAAARNMDGLKSPRTYYVCTKCGYVCDFTLPFCPSCREQHGLEDVQ